MKPKQRKFAREYLKDHNATKAYIRAGYSKAGAGTGGNRLLQNREVTAFIQQEEAKAVPDIREYLVDLLFRMAKGETPTKKETSWYQVKTGEVKPKDSITFDMRAAAMDLAKIEGLVIERTEDQNMARLLLDLPGMVDAKK